MYRLNLQSVALPVRAVPEIIALAVLGWGLRTPNLGKGGRRGRGWYRSKVSK